MTGTGDVHVQAAGSADIADWLALRVALHGASDDHRDDILQILARPERGACFIARGADGAALGFAEVALRGDYVNGCETSPVGFLEAIYTVPAARQRGVARALSQAVEAWTLARGCTELGSDALLDNVDSHAMHGALGFAETERVVFFRKALHRS
ncbi:MAG TPA: aminoglycoside 6'-N-acetyltransferase [Rhizomicrobium sp.]|jgi:aminoglycoside 6'-N-acetyltransferase I|nr:aminoglycoside 6'-N-acetyltransferase [Rhizomicrobium sp.]